MSVMNNCVKAYMSIFVCFILFYSGKLVLEINTSFQTFYLNLNLDTLPVISCFDECLGKSWNIFIGDIEIDIPFIESLSNPQKQNETGNLCSERSSRRGLDQKVVSFSFWGEMKNGYFKGIQDNLAMMETHYPGWVMRLHVSSAKLTNDSVRTLCDIQCNQTVSTM